MRVHVSFPKDKEEMQKKRLQAMLQKLGGKAAAYDVSGGAGERRLEEINAELTKYYKENKDIGINNNRGRRVQAQTFNASLEASNRQGV
jgi:hypothetical protein